MAIVGPSSSGETLCLGLIRSSTGTVELHETLLNKLNEDQLAAEYRNKYVGLFFQTSN